MKRKVTITMNSGRVYEFNNDSNLTNLELCDNMTKCNYYIIHGNCEQIINTKYIEFINIVNLD